MSHTFPNSNEFCGFFWEKLFRVTTRVFFECSHWAMNGILSSYIQYVKCIPLRGRCFLKEVWQKALEFIAANFDLCFYVHLLEFKVCLTH